MGLQWGRNLSVAEGGGQRTVDVEQAVLQWGRNLSVAEGVPPPDPRAASPGFNGAATFRLRKASTAACPCAPAAAQLQWGRNLSVAEGQYRPLILARFLALQWGRNLSVAEGASAALAPNRYSGFNGAATFRLRKVQGAASSGGPASRLQWGRNLSVAEGQAALSDHLKKAALQWGRNLSVAEGDGSIHKITYKDHASMGPQPFGCGREHAQCPVAHRR